MGRVLKTPLGSSPISAILKELKEINAKQLKKSAFILIAKDVFVALAVVVAKAPCIYESDSSILVILQTRIYDEMRKSIRISWTNCLHYKTLRIYKASDSI